MEQYSCAARLDSAMQLARKTKAVVASQMHRALSMCARISECRQRAEEILLAALRLRLKLKSVVQYNRTVVRFSFRNQYLLCSTEA